MMKISAILVLSLAVGYSTQEPIEWLVDTVAAGVSIKVSDQTIAVGAVTVPLDFLCGNFAETPEVCRLCDIDCIKTHNAQGGKCMAQTSGSTSCICDYSGTRTDPGCGHYTPTLPILPYLPVPSPSNAVDAVVDAKIASVLRGRYDTVICGPVDGEGTCDIECPNNHAALAGTCELINGVGFCTCHY